MATKIALPPYPTPIEIIRFLANAFGTKLNNKTLDDKALQLDADYRLIDPLIFHVIGEPIKKYISENTAELLSAAVKHYITDYSDLVKHVALDGVPRNESVKLLAVNYFAWIAQELLKHLHKSLGGPSPEQLITSNISALDETFMWLQENSTQWSNYVSGCLKEHKDRFNIWSKGLELPSITSIAQMKNWSEDTHTQIDWNNVCSLLLIAKAIDFCRKSEIGKMGLDAARTFLVTNKKPFDVGRALSFAQINYNQRYGELSKVGLILHHELFRAKEKIATAKQTIREKLNLFKSLQKKLDPENNTCYWLNWHEAKWQLFSGNLKNANKYYNKAFEECLYRAGQNQKQIIEEALVVAASQKRPDAIFMKKLKNMLISLGYELPTINDSKNEQPYKTSNVVEPWEIKLWKGHFKSIFPDEGMFVEALKIPQKLELGPLIISDVDNIKPDFRNPNRVIKVGETWTKKVPQLVWFCEHEKQNIVKKLLDKGANVNVFSESGDTPILMALQIMNVTNFSLEPLDDSLFNLLSDYKHKEETINKRTQKRRLLPIISGVQSGRIEVVKKLLKMGALPDKRGTTDNITPLMACLRLISTIKEPGLYLKEQMKTQTTRSLTPEFLDSFRRNTNGLGGFSLEQQKAYLSKNMNNETFNKLLNSVLKFSIKCMTDSLSLKGMRSIAKLLLESGANPNAEHSYPGKGYTPLMYAVELDEAEIFDAMLKKGGDPHKTYLDLRQNTQVDCRHIAHYFEAREVMNTLKSII